MTREEYNRISGLIVDTSVKVHQKLGPGLLESVYRKALAYELRKIGLKADEEVPFKCIYDGVDLGLGFRADLVVANAIIVELKATEENHPVYSQQLLSYLKITGFRLGLLINFGYPIVTKSIRRMVNNF